MKQLQDSSFSSVEEKSFDENSSQELSLESLSEISGSRATHYYLYVGGRLLGRETFTSREEILGREGFKKKLP